MAAATKSLFLDTATPNRSRFLREGEIGKGPVVYWMSREQRAHDNWALLHAQELALRQKKPLITVFCLTFQYPGANLRHYAFLLDGLRETAVNLERLHIPFFLLLGAPPEELRAFLREIDAGLLVCDFDPLRIKKEWKRRIITSFPWQVREVDGHNIIPCWLASSKQEYAAYTFRPKVRKLLSTYLAEFPELKRHPVSMPHLRSSHIDWQDLHSKIPGREISPVPRVIPGPRAAKKRLGEFIAHRLRHYADWRNDPNKNGQSHLSPYLHFGHISGQRIALAIRHSGAPLEACQAFLEELIVRRELADNFCHYNPDYDKTSGFPEWARATLEEHRNDPRRHFYELDQLEAADTHDPLWNAAQKDMIVTGKLHGYLRMYWAKKILEWTESPEAAMRHAIYLNDKYELDGRDPNGYAGIAWSIGGVHDRAWPERPVHGKIRSMSAKGCARKFDVARYIANAGTFPEK